MYRLVFLTSILLSAIHCWPEYLNSYRPNPDDLPDDTTALVVEIDLDKFPNVARLNQMTKFKCFDHNMPAPAGSFDEVLPKSIVKIDIERNEEFTRLPSSKHLTNLKILELNDNNIEDNNGETDLFPESLEEIYLSGNKLTTIPNLSNCPKLKIVYAFSNDIKHIEEPITKVFPTSLERLWVSANPLACIADFSGLSKLVELSIGRVSRNAECPLNVESMYKLFPVSLEKLTISLDSLPNFKPLANLRKLDMWGAGDEMIIDRPLVDRLPVGIEILELSHCEIKTFPDTRGLKKLKELDLSWNDMAGSIDEDMIDPDNVIEKVCSSSISIQN